MANAKPGDWIIYRRTGWGSASYGRAQVEKVTPKLLKLKNASLWGRQAYIDDLRLICRDQDHADDIIQLISGIEGERSQRVIAANDAARKAIERLFAKESAA